MAAVFDMLRESMQQSTSIQSKTRATMLPKIRKKRTLLTLLDPLPQIQLTGVIGREGIDKYENGK